MNLPGQIVLNVIVPAALLGGWGCYVLRRASGSRHWPVVPGTILESRVANQGKTRSPRVLFEYEMAERRRVARRLWVGPESISVSGDWADRVIARYPVGARVRVAVDPADPSYAVLEPGRRFMHWLPLAIAALVVIVGVFVATSIG